MSESMSVAVSQDVLPLLLFRVAGECFALDLPSVEEAVELPALHGVPTRERHLLGLVDWRGRLLPVYSARRALGVESGCESVALVVHDGVRHVGLAVDDVDDVLELASAAVRPVPVRGAPEPMLRGLVRHGDALVAVVEAAALVEQCAAEVPA